MMGRRPHEEDLRKDDGGVQRRVRANMVARVRLKGKKGPGYVV